MKKKLFDTEKQYKDTQKQKIQLENDCLNLRHDLERE
jgi:hypothetical protein